MKKSQAVQTFKLPAVKCYWTVTLLIFVLSYSLYRYLHFDAVRMCTFFLGYSYNSPFIILQAMSLFFSLWPHTVTEQVCKLVRCILLFYFPYSYASGY